MKKSKFTEAQIVFASRQAETGTPNERKASEEETFQIAEKRTMGLLEKIPLTRQIFENAHFNLASKPVKFGEYLHDGLEAGRTAVLGAYAESEKGELDLGEISSSFFNAFASTSMGKFSTREIANEQMRNFMGKYTTSHLSNILSNQTGLNDFVKETAVSSLAFAGRLFVINPRADVSRYLNQGFWFPDGYFMDTQK